MVRRVCVSASSTPSAAAAAAAAASGAVRHGSSIAVILLEDIVNKGTAGDIVKVKRGYARNLLVPRKKAAYATPENRVKFDAVIKTRKESSPSATTTSAPSSSSSSSSAAARRRPLTDVDVLTFARSVVSGSDAATTYGSVTALDIQAQLAATGYEEVDVSAVALDAPIKALGEYVVRVAGVDVKVRVEAAGADASTP